MAIVNTYTCLGTVNGNGTSPTLQFTNIPQGYTDLLIIAQLQPTSSSAVLTTIINGSTSGVYSTNWFGSYSNGTTTNTSAGYTTNQTSLQYSGLGYPVGTAYPTVAEIWINGYTNTNFNKSIGYRVASDQLGTNVTTSWHWTGSGSFASTAAVTSITLSTSNASYYWTSSSVASLYGVANQ